MSRMGELNYFLGLQVKQNEEETFICQSKYTRNLLKKFGMQDCSNASTLMATATKLDKDTGKSVDITDYRGMIGLLLYLSASRPDIMYVTCLCARFQADPREPHLTSVKRIFKYLKGTTDLGLWYPRESDFKLIGYSDADFAGCKIDRKITSGSCQFLGGRLVSWFSKKQKSIFTSTAEAEYIAAGSYCAQILWMKNQLLDYGLEFSKILIYCDNQSAIVMTGNPVQHSMTKHISIRYHFIREHVDAGTVELHFVPTDQQIADIFTKPLCEATFTRLVNELGMVSEPVVVEAEKVPSQKDTVTGSSRPLKRLRKLNSDDKAPTVSPPLKKLKKQRAHRDIVESDSEDVVEAAKEGGQESLILTEPIVIESLPSAQPETAQDRVPTPPVLYLEAPATQFTPPITPIQDVDFNENIPTTPIKNLDDENQTLEDADTTGSASSDAVNEETTGEAATNLNAAAAGPSGHAPQQTVNKADLVKNFVPSEKILVEHLEKADEMLINDDFKAQLGVTTLSTRHLQGQHSTTHAKTLKGKDDGNDDQGNSDKGRGQGQGKGFSSRMDFESQKEEEARLKAEGVKIKSKASVVEKKFPKPKGIVIKERTNSEATKSKSQVEIDPRSKGKEKVDEPVKFYMPVMDEEITEEDARLTLMTKKISQTTSDMAHVV
ncbi:hypothetical protein AgCh_028832 [Apium graveolens]